MKDEKTSLSDKIKGNTLLMDEKTKLIDENYVLQKKKTKDLAILKKVLTHSILEIGEILLGNWGRIRCAIFNNNFLSCFLVLWKILITTGGVYGLE